MRRNDWRPTTACGSAATCVASCHRCGRTQRPSSATSRRDPIRPRPSVAHRAAGITCWFAGEYREARDHLRKGARLVPTRPRRRSGLSLRMGPRRRRDGQSGDCVVASRRGRSRDFAHRPHADADRGPRPCRHARAWKNARGLVRIDARRPHARPRRTPSNLSRLAREHELPMWRAFGVFLEGWATAASGAIGGGLEDMRRGVELLREQNVLLFDGLLKIALAEAEARAGDLDRARRDPRRSAGDVRPHRLSRVRSRTASGARRNPAEARPRQSRARGRSFPDRHRRREAARDAQLRTARGAGARQALPIDRPSRRRARRPRARARRLLADVRNARDRRGAGAVGGYRGRRACEARINTAMAGFRAILSDAQRVRHGGNA